MRLRRLAHLSSAVALTVAGTLTVAQAPVAALPSVTNFVGPSSDQFVVPEGICTVHLELSGARGGFGGDALLTDVAGGARVTGALAVTPGEVLQVETGGLGGNGEVNADGSAEGGAGGYNGGAPGGRGHRPIESDNTPTAGGGGGGGATAVLRAPYGLSDRVAVAGGGGGSGAASDGGTRGAGGSAGAVGLPGQDGGPAGEFDPARGGEGGTQAAGGDAEPSADAGTAGAGGKGGRDLSTRHGGGGGGGGLFGGGGGGSSYSATVAAPGAAGGGGGSSLAPAGGAIEAGVNEATGFASIRFDPAVDACPVTGEISLTKTVSTEAGECGDDSSITVEPGTTVFYCYRLTNGTNTELPVHDLVDDKLGTILDDDNFAHQAGATREVISDGVVVDDPVVNVATWTALGSTGQIVDTATATASVEVEEAPVDDLLVAQTATCDVDGARLEIELTGTGDEARNLRLVIDGDAVTSDLALEVGGSASVTVAHPGDGADIVVIDLDTDEQLGSVAVLAAPDCDQDRPAPPTTWHDGDLPPAGGAVPVAGSPAYTG